MSENRLTLDYCRSTIDHPFRLRLAGAIEAYLDGSIDNWELDDVAFKKNTEDLLCAEIRDQLWLTYDDIKRYRNVGEREFTVEVEVMLRRWVVLLRTEIEWSNIVGPQSTSMWARFHARFIYPRTAPKCKFGSNPYWPLKDAAAWEPVLKEGQVV